MEGAKIENQTLKLDKEQFNLKEIVSDIVNDYDNILTVKGRKDVKLHYEPKDIFLVADKIRVGRVISNLLNNAIKFTSRGKITITTTEIKHDDESREIRVSIKDTGTGLSPAILPKLYSKFASTDSGGTGLGLFVSKNIIESHGGRMEAQNNLNGGGATFSFMIPNKLS